MKKFILYLLAILISVIVLDFGTGKFLDVIQRKAFERNPERFEVRAMYAIEKANSEVDIIGASDASHSYISNMIADSLGLTTFNYGKDGCFFIWQNCLVNLMLERHTPKMILWEIGKNSLSTPESKEEREWQSIKDFYPYYKKSAFCKNLIDSRGRFQQLCMLSGLYRFNSSILSIVEPFITGESIDNSTKGYLPLPNEGYIHPTFKQGKPLEDNIDNRKTEMLRSTLDICHEKGVAVVFCFSPKYKNDNIEVTSQWHELKSIASEYGVPLIDNENNQLFITDSTLFKDDAHLNDKGARLYMEYFIPQLKQTLAK
jgi:hypothetical protein